LRELKEALEKKDQIHDKQVHEKVTMKERELCDLQNRLMEELELKQQMKCDVIKRDRTILQLQQQLPPQLHGPWLQETDDAPQSILSVATPQTSFRTTKVPCSPRSFGPPVPLGAQSTDQYGREPVAGPAYSQKHFPSPGGSLRSVSQGGSATASPWTARPSKKPSGPMRRSNYTPSLVVDGAKSPGYKTTFNSPRSPHRCITTPVGSLPLSFMSSRSGDTFGSPVQHRRQCVHSESRLLHDKKERRLMLGAHTFA